MMRVCERALNFFQIYDGDGSVRLCSWTRDGYIGKLTENSIHELYNSPQAMKVKERHANDDYTLCKVDACPYLAMNQIEDHKIEIQEFPSLPESLFLGFERVCNYNCTSCNVHDSMMNNIGKKLDKNYDIIESRIREVLPKIKHISANGCGEIFACDRTMKILSSWSPEFKKDEFSVSLETNGSLFNKDNWEKIENIGQYYLTVSISIMSFNEQIYHYLSGTRLPIKNLIDNLYFVRELRHKGIINYLELATVVQEQNFREMPEFVKRCVDEFGADYVRLRPYEWWGECSKDEAWYKDIRNPHHPLYEEYKKVMNHELMRHPKVHDWGGGRDTQWASIMPSELQTLKLDIVTEISLYSDEVIARLEQIIKNKQHIYLYGLSNAGKVLSKLLRRRGLAIDGILDRKLSDIVWDGIVVTGLSDENRLNHDSPIIVCIVESVTETVKILRDKRWKTIVPLWDLLISNELGERIKRNE